MGCLVGKGDNNGLSMISTESTHLYNLKILKSNLISLIKEICGSIYR